MSGEMPSPVRLHGGAVDLSCDWLEIDAQGVLWAVEDFARHEICDLTQTPAIKGLVGGLLAEAGDTPLRCYLGDTPEPYDWAATETRPGYGFWRFDDGRLFLHRHWGRENVVALEGGRWHDWEDDEEIPKATTLILATALPPLPPSAPLGSRQRLSLLAARR